MSHKLPTGDAVLIRGVPLKDLNAWRAWCKARNISQTEAFARLCHLVEQGDPIAQRILAMPPRPREYKQERPDPAGGDWQKLLAKLKPKTPAPQPEEE